ncbi:MAG: PQQ-binding-like beta-propeller repeat protein [Planctomycetota bacterium]
MKLLHPYSGCVNRPYPSAAFRNLMMSRSYFPSCVALCGLVLAFCPMLLAEEWNQWRGPNRDSVWEGKAWPEKLDGQLELVWEKPLEPSYSGPIVQGGMVYTTETVGKREEVVSAFQLDSGELVWQKRWDGSMTVPFFASANGSWIRATPVVSKDALVIEGILDVLVCLDPATGKEKWRVDFNEVLGAPRPSFGGVCSPIIDGDVVYIQTGGPTVKLSLKDGSVIWKTLEDGGGMMSGGAFSSPFFATIGGDRQLLIQTRTELCGVDPESGDVLWKEPVEAFRGMNILTPTVIGDKIFTSAYGGRSHLFEISRPAGSFEVKEVWNKKSQGYMSSPIVIEDTIYMHGRNQRIIAIDVNSGEMLWSSRPMGKYQSMIRQGKRMLILDERGDLMLVRHNREELDIIDQVKVADDSWAHLAVTDDLVIVRDLNALKVFRLGGE